MIRLQIRNKHQKTIFNSKGNAPCSDYKLFNNLLNVPYKNFSQKASRNALQRYS